ncbi:uncharacterized protein B0P05DRAFT_531251 [Gilbertella persicaria]|uniref:uncharacterized protein n=1 Tax=Gilbertella persicaria TaxID=101096 RepID=UPI0022210D4A|nr:uncharacterized protein B0P05DRAFT_531251 [Gilbertella persicaria]KAI8088050.1 hypothetical protein B0P05DRAFT_531251 [Gilbertella persicaria]
MEELCAQRWKIFSTDRRKAQLPILFCVIAMLAMALYGFYVLFEIFLISQLHPSFG